MRSPDARGWMVGPLLVFAYCVINSSKSVLEASIVQRISPEFLAFNVFLVTQVFYLVTCRDRRRLRTAVRRSLRDVVGYNGTTMVSWLAVLYAFTVLEPAVANSIIIGLIPSLTIVVGFKMRPSSGPVPLEAVAAAGVLGAMGFLGWHAAQGSSAIGAVTPGQFAFGLTACAATAAAVAGNTFYTKRLSEAGMSVWEMMACRFVLLIVVTLSLVAVRDSAAPYSPGNVGAMLLISVVGVIVSLYVLQMGIVRSEPITVSMLFGINVMITYGVQFFDPRLQQSASTLAGVLALSAFMCLGAWGRYRHDHRTPPSAAGSVPATQPEG